MHPSFPCCHHHLFVFTPARAGFSFVGKKDGSLCPCIDYHGLNAITIKNRYLGVGAILSWAPKDNHLHPCSFFSYCLSLAQQKYAIGSAHSRMRMSPFKDEVELTPEHILPQLVTICALCLGIERRVQQTNSRIPVPDSCP